MSPETSSNNSWFDTRRGRTTESCFIPRQSGTATSSENASAGNMPTAFPVHREGQERGGRAESSQ
ncbi:hypothetical protein D7W82_37320 [Corallococcus sp. CA049B]|uniref:hypothetical protein n=1 Tax=Corallococcus sp. CA049B TaxID=2316730 RepID=UPI000EA2C2B6|nr:hypothetical protein [Corallococcus sp. CA049B]RKG74980.1 hypothetical protein D7W82_37320 [Corallococcus sp. CA049B]